MSFRILIASITVGFSFNLIAQLRLVPLQQDLGRNKAIESANFNAKNEAVSDSVIPGISIAMIEGHIPRCNTETNLNYVFQCSYFNGGSNPTIQWLVNGLEVGSGSSFSSSTLNNKDEIQCRLTSNLDCAKMKIAISNTIQIIDSTSLPPQIEIISIDNSIKACSADYPLTITANTFNIGSNATIKWFYSGTFSGSGSTYTRDSLANKRFIYAVITSDLACAGSVNIDTSNYLTREVARIISPTISISLDSVVNTDCTTKTYNFSANGLNKGANPLYSWYVNNVFVATTSAANFATSLGKNGDEVQVKMSSAISCSNPVIVSSNIIQRADIISLPFFDDFSDSFDQPDINRWIKKGGTYINNSYAISQPTQNTATFDGLKYNGLAYDSANVNARGKADNLTSLPIDLSQLTLQDSTFISFFWQPKGIGETPDGQQSDVLTLYFKNSNLEWVRVWEKLGFADTVFYREIIKINSDSTNNFFHSSFQFKFENTGRLSGTFDIWNLDYIYLNKNRNKNDVYFRDQSFSKQPIVLFPNNYTSLPYTHFNEIKSTLTDSILVGSNYNNLDQRGNNNTFTIDVINDVAHINILTKASQETQGNAANVVFENTIPGSFWASIPNQKTEVEYQFSLNGDVNNSDGKQIDYTNNNVLKGKTILDNFYAYDDGSAEYGIGLNQKFSVLLYRFRNYKKPDTLRQIAISLTQLGKVLIQQSFNLVVSTNLPTLVELTKSPLPSNVLVNDNFPITYATTVNNWTIYELREPIIINADSFFIGYKQITDDALAIGWDRNNNASDQIFYNINNKWEPYTDSEGSLLMRPVFGNFNYLLNTKPGINHEAEVTIYPSPTERYLHSNMPAVKAQLFNIQGVVIKYFTNTNEFDLGDISSGIYILKLEIKGRSYWKKVMKQ